MENDEAKDNRKLDSCLDCFDAVWIVLVVLKAVGTEPVASWSWAIVLSPFWGSIAAVAVFSAFLPLARRDRRKSHHGQSAASRQSS